ncbi:hypothetical protein [Streptomyces griseus]|nr:hypothetical protein [Streptomyces griseus]
MNKRLTTRLAVILGVITASTITGANMAAAAGLGGGKGGLLGLGLLGLL